MSIQENTHLITLGAMLQLSVSRWPDHTAMLVPEGSDFRAIRYRELADLVRGYAGVLRSLGAKKGDRVCIQSENCYEWALCDWGCQSLGVILVPIYPTLPADQSQYIVNDCGAKLVIAGSSEQAAKSSALDSVRVVLLKGAPDSIVELTKDKSLHLSDEEWTESIKQTDPEDIATFIYTSGTTGQPKGAMIPHRALTWLCTQIRETLPFGEGDIFLTFLPMSHVFERVAGQVLPLSSGGTCAYSKGLASLAGDIQKVNPTIMLVVPRFLEATKEKILDAVEKYPPLRKKLFNLALKEGVKKARGGFSILMPLLDKLVCSKVRARLGTRLRFFVSGGAALPAHVAEFYMAMGIKVLQGYGLTETTAATSFNPPEDSKYWTIGMPIRGVEVKVADDGEILVRGLSVMKGYYNLPEETANAIDSEGWFHTGDIGEWEGKHLKITDRKKDILVLANGKNVAPQPIENKLKESPFIQEAVVFGDGSEFCYALIVPSFEKLKQEPALSDLNENEIADHELAKSQIKKEIDAINKSLADFEKVKKHTLVHATFSVESGELTPSLKVRRKVVREKFAKELDALKK